VLAGLGMLPGTPVTGSEHVAEVASLQEATDRQREQEIAERRRRWPALGRSPVR
jgi:hypothetical protein